MFQDIGNYLYKLETSKKALNLVETEKATSFNFKALLKQTILAKFLTLNHHF